MVLCWYFREINRIKMISPLGDPKCSQKTKHSTYQTKLDKVESILGSLKQKHAAAYPEKKLRAWAHLIEMEKHVMMNHPIHLSLLERG